MVVFLFSDSNILASDESESEGKGHNSICSVFHQIRWDGKALSFLARETVLAFQSPLLPALRMGHSVAQKNLARTISKTKCYFLPWLWSPGWQCYTSRLGPHRKQLREDKLFKQTVRTAGPCQKDKASPPMALTHCQFPPSHKNQKPPGTILEGDGIRIT